MKVSDPDETRFLHKFRWYHLALLSALSGLLLTATLPVRGMPLVMLVAFVPLLILEEHFHRNRARYPRGVFFLLVLLSFLIWNTAGSWWLKNASTFGAVMAVLVNTLLMALVMQLFHDSRKTFRKRNIAYAVFLCFWMGFEYFHHNWDLTYPWFSLGNAFSSYPEWVQWYEYTGMPGGTLWLLLVNLLAFSLVRDKLEGHLTRKALARRITALSTLVLLPLLLSLIIFHTYEEKGGKVEVVLVQPNNDPYYEQYSISPLTAVGDFLHLAQPLMDSSTAFVVGPESMIQESIWEGYLEKSPSIDSIRNFLAHHPDLTVIVGASSFRMIPANQPVPLSARQTSETFLSAFADAYEVPREELSGWYDAYNLGVAVDTTGVTGLTHKSKLVAGVERMPFKRLLSGLVGDLALDMGGTIGTLAIDDERFVFTHNASGDKYGIAICYESVFGEFFGQFVKNGAAYMFIITNDGWWGDTPGHRQHNAFASLRAIETRRDIARSANTGITCFINQRGEVLQPTTYWTPDAIKGQLHANHQVTFYVRHGDYLGRISLFMSLLLLIIHISYKVLPLHRRKSDR